MPYYVVNTEEHKLSSANLYYDAPMIEQVSEGVRERTLGSERTHDRAGTVRVWKRGMSDE